MCYKVKFKLPWTTMWYNKGYRQWEIIEVSCDEALKFNNIFEVVSKDWDCSWCLDAETVPQEEPKKIQNYKNKKSWYKGNKDCSAC